MNSKKHHKYICNANSEQTEEEDEEEENKEELEEQYDSPVEVGFVSVTGDAAEWIHSEPGAEGEAALIRPPGDRRQRYGLEENRITLLQ